MPGFKLEITNRVSGVYIIDQSNRQDDFLHGCAKGLQTETIYEHSMFPENNYRLRVDYTKTYEIKQHVDNILFTSCPSYMESL